MKIYTKTGDKGQTSLIGGTRVLKSHLRIESYGTVDELNSCIGLAARPAGERAAQSPAGRDPGPAVYHWLFAGCRSGKIKDEAPDLREDDITRSGKGNGPHGPAAAAFAGVRAAGRESSVSFGHLARCRLPQGRAPRDRSDEESPVDETLVKYLNRLSDYLFVLSRMMAQELQATEFPWTPACKAALFRLLPVRAPKISVYLLTKPGAPSIPHSQLMLDTSFKN